MKYWAKIDSTWIWVIILILSIYGSVIILHDDYIISEKINNQLKMIDYQIFLIDNKKYDSDIDTVIKLKFISSGHKTKEEANELINLSAKGNYIILPVIRKQ